MTTQIIDGKQIAFNLRQEIAKEVKNIRQKEGADISLAVILVGNNPASEVYVRNKEKAAHESGINSVVYKLNEDIKEDDLLKKIDDLNNDKNIHGILVQLPLPKHINSNKVIHKINYKKDVDGFNLLNIGMLSVGNFQGIEKPLLPCTPQGCLHLIKSVLGADLRGKNALIIGASNIVGKPMASLLINEKCTVTIANASTKNLNQKTLDKDIIISATGVINLITEDMVSENSCIIDVGINRINLANGKTKIVGDVDFESVSKKVKYITPVPGGVGPMTIAYLLKNTIEAYKVLNNIS